MPLIIYFDQNAGCRQIFSILGKEKQNKVFVIFYYDLNFTLKCPI